MVYGGVSDFVVILQRETQTGFCMDLLRFRVKTCRSASAWINYTLFLCFSDDGSPLAA